MSRHHRTTFSAVALLAVGTVSAAVWPNAQCGLVSTADVPYSELVSAIRDISCEMYPRRYSEHKR